MVTDPSGAGIPAASVAITNIATNASWTTTSSAEGRFSVLYLPPGEYTITGEVSGFKKLIRQGVNVRIGDELALQLQLELGQVQESVTVVAEAALLETESSSAGQVIDRRRLAELPLSDGNPFTLARLAAGVVYTSVVKNDRPFDNGGTSRVAANGASGYSEFTLDGSPNMGAGTRYTGVVAYIPPTDSVQEVKIETLAYDAQHGHTASAYINVMLKSGTNQLHGTAYEFFRNDKLSANDFFLNRAGRPRPPLRYNRWGGSVGGPVRLPKIYDGRNHTFFFFAYEGIKDKFPAARDFTVPSDAQRKGDLSALRSEGITIYDPLTASPVANGRLQREPFPNNIIPSNRLNPIAQNYLNFYPGSNQPGDSQGRNNFLTPLATGDDFHSEVYRFDHQTNKQRMFFSFRHNFRTAFQGNWTGDTGGIQATGNLLIRENNGATFDHVYTLSPTTMLNFRFGFSRFSEERPRHHEGQFQPAALGFSPQTAALFGDVSYFPRFSIRTFSSLGDSVGAGVWHNIYSVQPTLTTIAGNGRHQVKFGYDFRAYRENWINPGHAAGRYDFLTNYTRGPLDNAPSAVIGQGLAAFLLGQPTGGVFDRNASRANQTIYHGLFFHDDWKVTSRLTLNLGLRYEYELPTTERFNRNVRSLDTTSSNPIEEAARAAYAANPISEISPDNFGVRGGYVFANEQNRGFWEPDKNNFSPRLGFAYRLDNRTVLRGGWAIFTVPFTIDGANQDGFSQATSIVPTLDNGLTFVADLNNPFPNGVIEPPGASLGLATFLGRSLNFPIRGARFASLDRKNDQAMRWSIGIQRELPGNWLVDASYVGNRGYDLTAQTYILNALPAQYLSTSSGRDQETIDFLTTNVTNPFQGLIPGTSLNGSVVQRQQLLLAMPQFLLINKDRSEGSSTFHSMQLRFEKRFAGGYSFLSTYMYSRLLERTTFKNWQDTEFEERLSPNDRTQRLVLSGVWEFPFGRGRKWGDAWGGLSHGILGGWQVQGVWQLQSGGPLFFGADYIFEGDPKSVQLSGGERTIDRWFNTSGFERNSKKQLRFHRRTSPTVFPNVRQHGTNHLDLSVMKVFNIGERVNFQLRAEFLNAMNRAQFQNPSTSPTSSRFGLITRQANKPRDFQIGGKFVF